MTWKPSWRLVALAAAAASRDELVLGPEDPADAHRERRRTFSLPRSGTVAIRQLVGSGSVGAAQWDGGYALADYIERTSLASASCAADGCDLRSRYANKTALELGAGAGGLVAVALLNSGARVLATDGDSTVLGALDANVRANAGNTTRFVGAARLRWDDAGDLDAARAALGRAPDLVVAADVAFRNADTAALVALLVALSPCDIILAHTFRFYKDDANFLAALDDHFIRDEVPRGEMHPSFRAGGTPMAIYRLLLRD